MTEKRRGPVAFAMLWLLAVAAQGAGVEFRQRGFWHQVYPINEFYCGTAVAVETAAPGALLDKTACAQDVEAGGRHVSFYCRLDSKKARVLIDRIRAAGRLLALRPGCETIPKQPEIYFVRDSLTADRQELDCEATPSVCGLVDDRLVTADYLVRLHEAAAPLAIMVFAREIGSDDPVRFRSPTRLPPPVHSGPWARVSRNPCEQVPVVQLRFAEAARPAVLAKFMELGEDARTPCMGKPAYLLRDEKALKDFIAGLEGFREWRRVTLPEDEGRLDDAERVRRLTKELAAHGEDLEKRAPHARALTEDDLAFMKPYAERIEKVRAGLVVEPRFER